MFSIHHLSSQSVRDPLKKHFQPSMELCRQFRRVFRLPFVHFTLHESRETASYIYIPFFNLSQLLFSSSVTGLESKPLYLSIFFHFPFLSRCLSHKCETQCCHSALTTLLTLCVWGHYLSKTNPRSVKTTVHCDPLNDLSVCPFSTNKNRNKSNLSVLPFSSLKLKLMLTHSKKCT